MLLGIKRHRIGRISRATFGRSRSGVRNASTGVHISLGHRVGGSHLSGLVGGKRSDGALAELNRRTVAHHISDGDVIKRGVTGVLNRDFVLDHFTSLVGATFARTRGGYGLYCAQTRVRVLRRKRCRVGRVGSTIVRRCRSNVVDDSVSVHVSLSHRVGGRYRLRFVRSEPCDSALAQLSRSFIRHLIGDGDVIQRNVARVLNRDIVGHHVAGPVRAALGRTGGGNDLGGLQARPTLLVHYFVRYRPRIGEVAFRNGGFFNLVLIKIVRRQTVINRHIAERKGVPRP